MPGVSWTMWRIAGVAAIGPLMTNLDSTMVNVALSPLARSLGTDLSTIQWVTSGYLLALALALPLSGWLVDRWGTRLVYLGCFGAFTIASALCALSSSPGELIAARVLQGLAGGLLAPLAQMTVARVAGADFSRVMGVIVLPVLIGPIFGPVIGGLILQWADWPWLFLVNVPLGVIAMIAAWRVLPRGTEEAARRSFDGVGALLLCPAMVCLLLGLDRVGHAMALPVVAILIGLLLATGFVVHARSRGPAALVDVRLFANGVFATSAAAQCLSNGVVIGGQVLLPLILLSRGMTPAGAGWALAATGLGAVISYPAAGWLVGKIGARNLLLLGAGFALAGTAPFVLAAGTLPVGWVLAALVARGLGIGGMSLPSLASAYRDLRQDDVANATTTLNIAQRLGGPVAATAVTLVAGVGGGLAMGAALLCLAAIGTGLCAFGLPGAVRPRAATT